MSKCVECSNEAINSCGVCGCQLCSEHAIEAKSGMIYCNECGHYAELEANTSGISLFEESRKGVDEVITPIFNSEYRIGVGEDFDGPSDNHWE
jgi:hypothetical protein